MDFSLLTNIEDSLKTMDCKSYSLEIKFDDNNRVLIEKKPEEKEKKIGFQNET